MRDLRTAVFARIQRVPGVVYSALVPNEQGMARALEAEGEEAAVDYGLEALVRIFGAAVKHKCRGAKATRWGADPFAFGSYSVARPGKHALRGALDDPFDDRLFIAGECWRSDGTAALVSGAYQSGWDRAGQVLGVLAQ